MKPKATWEPEYHRVFVDLCVQQKVMGNKPGTQHLLEPFQQRMGAKFNKKQLKNHWDTMCKQWKIWRRLVQCSYMKWDPRTYTFNASNEDWANYILANPDAGPYRLGPPLFLNKLEIIFEGDDEAGSSKCKRKRRSMHHEEEAVTRVDASNFPTHNMQIPSTFTTHNMQIPSTFSTPQSKGYWTSAAQELFLDLLVQETYRGNRPNTHYPKESWRMMLETINAKTGQSFTKVQMKNHWDCTRKAWKIWCQIIGNPIMKWDPNTRSFGATEEDWSILIRDNPRAILFRKKQILFADKLAIIFQGVIEPGKADFRPYRRKKVHVHSESPKLHDPTPLSTLFINEPVTVTASGDKHDGNGEHDTPHLRRFNRVGFAESRLQGVEIATPICTRFEAERLSKVPLETAIQYQYTIGECIECMNAMEEVEQGSQLYLFALDLFLRKEYREIFLELNKSSLRMSWLLRLQDGLPKILF